MSWVEDTLNQVDFIEEVFSKENISLPWVDFVSATKLMLYGGFILTIGEELIVPDELKAHSSTRLYDYEETTSIFNKRKIKSLSGFGEYNSQVIHSDDYLQLIIVSEKGFYVYK